jgi:acyl-CoA thioester hydrolase
MHTFPVTVYYEDTDMAGIVYHANWLKYVERASSDLVRRLGIDQAAMRAAGRVFAVAHVDAAFRAPARLDDRLTVTSRAVEAGGARLVLDQRVTHDATGRLYFEARVTVVCMRIDGRPARLPAELRSRVAPEG